MLYKIFRKEEYAYDFAHCGRMRFGNLLSYKSVEDTARRDEHEGNGYIQFDTDEMISVHMTKDGKVAGESVGPGVMNLSSTGTNPRFLLCCSYPPGGDTAQLSSKFGRWAVRIADPKRLALDVTEHLLSKQLLDFPIECARVRYDHGRHFAEQPLKTELQYVSYAYKPAHFADEYEYRLILMTGLIDAPVAKDAPYWEIDLGRRLKYAEVVQLGEG